MEEPVVEEFEARRATKSWLRVEGLLLRMPMGSRDRMAQADTTRPLCRRLLLRALTSGEGLTVDEASASRTFNSFVAPRSLLVGGTGLWRPLTFNMTAVMVVRAARAKSVAPGKTKPLSSLQLQGTFSAPRKVAGIVTVTAPTIEKPEAENLLFNALAAGEIAASNEEVIAIIRASTSLSVSGATISDFLSLAFAKFAASYSTSRFLLIVSPHVGRQLAGAMGASGLLYPTFDPASGGMVGQLRTFIDESLADGEVILVDADGFGCDAGQVRFDFTKESSLEFDDAPTHDVTTPKELVALWQTNSVGYLAERSFSFEPLRADSAVVISGIGVTP